MPVALMSYPVRDLLQAARRHTEVVHPVCVPTVLDHEFTACFLPAPRRLPYGRTLQLMGDPACEHKIAEVLHQYAEWPGRFRPLAHRMDRSMTMPLETNHTPEWLERFRVEPKAALDAMLRGLARIPPYERAAPLDILDRLFGGLPKDDPDLHLLDETLHDWLAARCMDMDPERHAEYGLSRFVTETMAPYLPSGSWVCPAAALGFRTTSWS